MKKEFSLARLLPVIFGFFIMGFVDIIGVGTSNVKADFSSLSDTQANLLSLSLQRRPDRANEVSALLIAGIAGGAVLPPILGAVSGWFGTQSAAMAVLIVVWLYMVWLIREVKKPVL